MAVDRAPSGGSVDKAAGSDPIPAAPFVRYALAGWVFVAVLLSWLADVASPADWRQVSERLSNPAFNTIAILVFSAIAGLSGPPALGFVLARASTSFYNWCVKDRLDWWRARWDAMRHIVRRRGQHAARITLPVQALKGQLEQSFAVVDLDERALMRMLFVASAPPSLVASRDRHATTVQAAVSSAVAIFAAWITAVRVSGRWSWTVFLLTAFLATGLIGAAIAASARRGQERKAWARTYGVIEAQRLGKRAGSRPFATQTLPGGRTRLRRPPRRST